MTNVLKEKEAQKQDEKYDSPTHEQLIREIAEGYETDEEVGPNLKNEALAKSMSKMAKGKVSDKKLKENFDKQETTNWKSIRPKKTQRSGG